MEINYSTLQLKTDKTYTTFTFNDAEIEVFNYISMKDKYDIIMIALRDSAENGVYNPIKFQNFLNLHIFLVYARNITMDVKDKDKMELFDEIFSSGLLKEFLQHMSKDEYDEIWSLAMNAYDKYTAANLSISTTLTALVSAMPKMMAEVTENLKNLDMEQVKELINLTKGIYGSKVA